MRKRLKKKRRSCALCKPNKMGWANRWKDKEAARLKEFEKEKETFLRGSSNLRPFSIFSILVVAGDSLSML